MSRQLLMTLACICTLLLIGGRAHTVLVKKNAERTGQPAKAVLERTEWDFGDISAGPILQVKLPIANAGGQRLILRESDRSCECLTGSHPEIIVPPGKSANLVARVETKHLSGPMRLELFYSTNDPQQRKLTLVLLANVNHGNTDSELPLQPIAGL
jgi:hypothetical protein